MSEMTNAEIKEAMSKVLLDPVEDYLSSKRSGIKNPGHSTPREYVTDELQMAPYGFGVSSMGNPFPYKDGEKGTLPLIPNETLIDQLSTLTARVAEQVQPNLQRVSPLLCPPFTYPNNSPLQFTLLLLPQ